LLKARRVFPLQLLYRNDTVEAGVASFPDFAHATCADGCEIFMRTEFLDDGKWHAEGFSLYGKEPVRATQGQDSLPLPPVNEQQDFALWDVARLTWAYSRLIRPIVMPTRR
jgi:hypothetical protein